MGRWADWIGGAARPCGGRRRRAPRVPGLVDLRRGAVRAVVGEDEPERLGPGHRQALDGFPAPRHPHRPVQHEERHVRPQLRPQRAQPPAGEAQAPKVVHPPQHRRRVRAPPPEPPAQRDALHDPDARGQGPPRRALQEARRAHRQGPLRVFRQGPEPHPAVHRLQRRRRGPFQLHVVAEAQGHDDRIERMEPIRARPQHAQTQIDLRRRKNLHGRHSTKKRRPGWPRPPPWSRAGFTPRASPEGPR